MSTQPPSHSENRPENRLGRESSPYLLLHKHNPVEWYPWGEEALGRARSEDRPIFLSVGYSTCYWCHVMERESFSDPRTAALMNREFVNIKVDREERPDLDEIYMTATQLLTGQGGWPNSVFLTPALAPFYAGTYFPPEDRYGRPGFRTLLTGLAESWRQRRDEVELQADELARAMRRYLEERVQPGDEPPAPAVADAAVESLAERFDPEWGGFGRAPKFPVAADLFLLHERAVAEPPDRRAADMLHTTLDQMARGGLYDQLAGGFHRYSTDRAWKVPHFEKMLYDNGLLLEAYAREHERTGDPEMGRVASETAAFLAREMTVDGGGFASAIDAETDGHEGAYYVWTEAELRAVLAEEDFELLAPLYGFAGAPFFEETAYVLHLPERLDAQAKRRRLEREELLAAIAPLRERLLSARSERERPLTDDKVLADWNGLAIAGMAEAGRLLGTPEWVERAARAADFVLGHLRPRGRLMHTWRGGQARVSAMAADYAFLVHGLLALHAAKGDEHWLAAAAELAGEQIERLGDGSGGFYAAPDLPDLLLRPKDALDGAVPSASGIAAGNFLALAERTGDGRWLREARRTLSALGPLLERYPEGNRTAVAATLRWYVATARGHVAAAEGEAEGGANGAAGPGLLQAEAEATAKVDAEISAAGADGWRRFRITLALVEGWHANAHTATDPSLVPTTVEGRNADVRGLGWPEGEPLAEGAAEAGPEGGPEVYRGAVEITGEVRPQEDGEAALVLVWQPCDDTRCLPPVRRTVLLK